MYLVFLLFLPLCYTPFKYLQLLNLHQELYTYQSWYIYLDSFQIISHHFVHKIQLNIVFRMSYQNTNLQQYPECLNLILCLLSLLVVKMVVFKLHARHQIHGSQIILPCHLYQIP